MINTEFSDTTLHWDCINVSSFPLYPLVYRKGSTISIITETETIQSQSHNNQGKIIHSVSVYSWGTEGREQEYHLPPQLTPAFLDFSPVIARNS